MTITLPPLMNSNLPPQMYGIWVRGKGWWKVPADGWRGWLGFKVAYADVRKEIVEQYAVWVGGVAQPIDAALERNEKDLLAHENERAKGKETNVNDS